MRIFKLSLSWFEFLIIIVLLLGIFFRFANIDRKVYWHDEVYTSLRVAGYTQEEIIQQVFDGHVISPKDLQKFQHLSPEKGLGATINALVKNPQHPPLYYLMERFWMQMFGSSVAVTRSLSAFISLLVFPSVYWLCLELFKSPSVGWVAIALIAVSPFHLLYAQEAREYSLWTVTILLSSASLLRAIRLKTKLSWVIYAITLALALYSFLFSIFVAIAHGIYMVIVKFFQKNQDLTAYFLSSFTGFIFFIPWIFAIYNNWLQFQETTSWTTKNLPQPLLFNKWLLHLNGIFLDIGLDIDSPFIYLISAILLTILIYTIYFLCCHTPQQTWLFILTLIAVTALVLVLPDLIVGGQRSFSSRYLIPCFLGIQLAVAYLLATQIFDPIFSHQKTWQAILLVMLSGGIVSCVMISQAETWWNKPVGYHNHSIARVINQASHPLLLSNTSDINIGDVISLSYLLTPKVQLQLVVDPNIPKLPADCVDTLNSSCTVFLFYPSESLKKGLEKEYNAREEVGYKTGDFTRLWKLAKR